MPAVWAPWTHRPTCRKDLGCHSQEGVGHHGLGLQGDVQLAGHVAVDAGPDQLQLVCCGHTGGSEVVTPTGCGAHAGLGPAHSSACGHSWGP